MTLQSIWILTYVSLQLSCSSGQPRRAAMLRPRRSLPSFKPAHEIRAVACPIAGCQEARDTTLTRTMHTHHVHAHLHGAGMWIWARRKLLIRGLRDPAARCVISYTHFELHTIFGGMQPRAESPATSCWFPCRMCHIHILSGDLSYYFRKFGTLLSEARRACQLGQNQGRGKTRLKAGRPTRADILLRRVSARARGKAPTHMWRTRGRVWG